MVHNHRMRLLLVCIIAWVALAYGRPAHAIVACDENFGVAPRDGEALPPRATVAVFAIHGLVSDYAATLDGKEVPLKVTRTTAKPYDLHLLQVDSDATGALQLYRVWTSDKGQEIRDALARYVVRAKVKLPRTVTGTVRRLTYEIRHTSVTERYDLMEIDLAGGDLAIWATIKLRRDSKAIWTALEVPLREGSRAKSIALLVGKLGCKANYSVPLLEAGVEVEASVTLVDGSTRPIALPSRVKLRSRR